jgi:glycine dehydrogenase subunit 1
MADFTPHTDAEIAEMLAFCGLAAVEELFAAVPAAIRLASGSLQLPPGRSEPDTLADLGDLADANRVGRDLVCFAGGGAYDHDVASVVRRVAFRAEYVTAYTPYQPEVAQGVLQALFEYQTLVARLSGLPVANASLYDGATATVEAINLAVAATGNQRVLLSKGVNPRTAEVVATLAVGTGHVIESVPLDPSGLTAWPPGPDRGRAGASGDGASGDGASGDGAYGDRAGGDGAGAVVVQYPNYLGVIEDLVVARAAADAAGALLVVVMDPVAMGLLRSPGSLGADVVVGEGQVFGTPLSFGGPYVGLFSCRQEHVRRLPGRLVGETVDVHGTTSYVTTLRTREQDIRREKASSNVCTNQTLIAVCCAIQLGWLGASGLREMALRCARGTRYTRDALLAVDGVSALVGGPVLREFAVRTPIPAATVVDRMTDEGYLAGIALEDDSHGLLIAVTERRTREEIDGFVSALEKVTR